MVELAEVGDDMLAWPSVGAHALDQGVVGVSLAVLNAGVATQKHGSPLVTQNDEGAA